MKRYNIHLEESQIEEIAKRAKIEEVVPAQLIRIAIDFYLSLSEPIGPMADVEFVRQKMIEKRGGDDVDYREVLRELAYEKAIEYRNKQNNAARITTLVEKEEITQETMLMVVEELSRLAQSVDRLVEVIHAHPSGA